MSTYQAYLEVKGKASTRLNSLQAELTWPRHVTLTSQDYEFLSKQRDILRSAIEVSERLVDGVLEPFSSFQALPLEKINAKRKAKIDDLFGKLTEAARVFDPEKVDVVKLAIDLAGERVEQKTGYNPVKRDI